MNKKLYNIIFKHQYENLPIFTKRLYKLTDNEMYYCPKEKVTYEEAVEILIREKYSINDEIALIRQQSTKPVEFNDYFVYAEECKVKAKAFIEERENWLN